MEMEKSKWYWINRLEIDLDLYKDYMISSQKLMAEIITLYTILEEEEGLERLRGNLKKIKKNGKT